MNAVRYLAYNPADVKPGWIAFIIVMLLIGATVLLWRNMNHQLGKINVPTAASFRAKGPRRSGGISVTRDADADEGSASASDSAGADAGAADSRSTLDSGPEDSDSAS